jgi:hypothetical protein
MRLKLILGEGWVVIEGGHYLLIPYGGECDEQGVSWFEKTCHLCDAPAGAFHQPDCSIGTGCINGQRPAEIAEDQETNCT